MKRNFCYRGKRTSLSPFDYDVFNFWSYVEKTEGCWLWNGPVTEDGYGRLTCKSLGKRIRAHRFSWYLEHGTINESLFACHKCDTPLCVNPAHLFLGTNADNVADCVSKGRCNHHLKVRVGCKNGRAKLTEDQVSKIKNRLVNCKRGDKTILARVFGVSGTVIGHIGSGKLWSHVEFGADCG